MAYAQKRPNPLKSSGKAFFKIFSFIYVFSWLLWVLDEARLVISNFIVACGILGEIQIPYPGLGTPIPWPWGMTS